jgi:hypothetical protein
MTEKKLKGLFGGGEADEAPSAAPARRERRERRGGGGGGRRRRRMTEDEAARAPDFVQRYTTGHPSEGFSSEEAVGYLRELRGQVPPETLQRAAVETVKNLPEDQRKAFAEMLQRRKAGAGMVTIERSGQAHEAARRCGGQAGGLDMDDMLGGLFGGLLGGGMAQSIPEPQAQPRPAPGGFGADDMLGGLLGGLLGGGAATEPRGSTTASGNPFDDLLGGLLGGGAAPEPEPRARQQPQAQDQAGGIGDILGSPLGKAVLGGIAAYAMKEMMDKGRKA